MTDARVLLERHRPRLVYDSQEAYFADSAAVWTDSPANVLRRAGGAVVAKPPKLSLAFLGPRTYSGGEKVAAGDEIGDTTRAYASNAAAMHRQARYRDRVYGHARRDPQGRLWLQYWLFYYYNDFRLVGSLLAGGKHEGDWELVQLRLNASEQPDLAVYSQHKEAERRPWAEVRKSGNSPLVYVARGSHANYFRAGSHFTGVWFDQADGKGPEITPKLEVVEDTTPWMLWPGRWGDTKATGSPLDSNSPNSPGRRPHWLDPSLLLAVATAGQAALPAPAPPRTTVQRAADRLVVAYDAPPEAAALVVAVRPKGSTEPAATRAIALDGALHGEVEVDAGEGDYDVWTSVVDAEGAASEGAGPT